MSDYHETIHMQTTQNGAVVDMLWDNYEGFGFNYYRILLDSTGLDNWVAFDSVTNANFTYTDIDPPSGNVRYQVEVVHTSGCTADKVKNFNSSKSNTSTGVGSAGNLTATITGTDASQGACDGSATVTVTGGIEPYTYAWDGGTGFQTSPTANGLCAGNYLVTVTDVGGDTLVLSIAIGEAAGTALSASTTVTDANAGLCDGTATVTATGGTPPYNFQWDGNTGNQTTQTAVGLCPGTYSVIVTDSTGNQVTVFASVSTVISINPTSDIPNPKLSVYPNPNSGIFIIEIEELVSSYELIIYNTLGQQIKKSKIRDAKSEIDLSVYAPGIYTLQILTDDVMLHRKVVIR